MVIDEGSRHTMFTRLQEVLGEESAAVLMEHLPPTGWADVATKRDVNALRVATKHDLDELRVATKQEFDALRVATKQDMDALRVATKQEFDALRVATKQDIEVTEHRILATTRAEMNQQTKTFVTWLIAAVSASNLTVAAIAFGAARLV